MTRGLDLVSKKYRAGDYKPSKYGSGIVLTFRIKPRMTVADRIELEAALRTKLNLAAFVFEARDWLGRIYYRVQTYPIWQKIGGRWH